MKPRRILEILHQPGKTGAFVDHVGDGQLVNATTQWLLTNGTIALASGTRSIAFQFNVAAHSGIPSTTPILPAWGLWPVALRA